VRSKLFKCSTGSNLAGMRCACISGLHAVTLHNDTQPMSRDNEGKCDSKRVTLTPDSRSSRSCFLRLIGAAAVKMSEA